MIPVFVICRDRVTPLRRLVENMEKTNKLDIILVDNDSTYEPLKEYLKASPHQVVYLKENGGHHGPWDHGLVPKNSFFGVTDPDVVPIDEAPLDYPDVMTEILGRIPSLVKVGFSLRIDNLPDHYMFKQHVLAWERQFWERTYLVRDNVPMYDAPLDTTFAFYNKGASWDLAPSIRTGYPYVAEHTPWYVDSENPSEEDLYYKEHSMRVVTTWLHDYMSDAIRGVLGF